MDALKLLEQDHKKVKQLMEKAEEAGNAKNQKGIFEEIKTELEIHSQIEETVFYPACKNSRI